MRISDWSSDVCSSDLIRIGAQNDIGELFGGCEAALRQNSGVEFRLSCQRKIADLAPGTLAVLLLNRSERFGGGKPVIGKLLRIEPDAHRVGRCEYRSAERRVGKECVSPGRTRGWPVNQKK